METEGFLSKFFAMVMGKEEDRPAVMDSTVYEIQTNSHTYTGKIAFQDDKVMKLALTSQDKAVKILKENIKRVNIIEKASTSYQLNKTTVQKLRTIPSPA